MLFLRACYVIEGAVNFHGDGGRWLGNAWFEFSQWELVMLWLNQ